MKRQLLFGCAVAVLFLATQAVWAQPEGLVAYWPFDEGSGDTAFDASGNGNDGVLNGGPAWVEGQILMVGDVYGEFRLEAKVIRW